jgi:hypothetical protein
LILGLKDVLILCPEINYSLSLGFENIYLLLFKNVGDDITLFISIIVFCGTIGIPHNIPLI